MIQILAERYYGTKAHPLFIGRERENNVRTVVFTSLKKYREANAGGSWKVYTRRPEERNSYVVPSSSTWESEEGYACWDVKEEDLTSAGFGEVELRFYPSGDVLDKNYLSRIWISRIGHALLEEGEEPEVDGDNLDIIATKAGAIRDSYAKVVKILGNAVIDDSLDRDSEHAVENKAITNALEIQNERLKNFEIPTAVLLKNGFYDLDVDVHDSSIRFGSIYISSIGTYEASNYDLTGFDTVEVAVPNPTLMSLYVKRNGLYSPENYGVDGFSAIEVNVVTGNKILAKSFYSLNDYKDYEISYIDDYAFCGCSIYLNSVYFPACISIGEGAFYFCLSLTSISFPVCTSIGDSAFYRCSRLTEASFPSCTSIGENAFYSCSSLVEASFPACTEIGSHAFYWCFSLASVSFPVCTTIGNSAFMACSSLTSVSFPACITIGESAFCDLSTLTSISFPACSFIGKWAFWKCLGLTEVSFPVCTEVGDTAFAHCSALTSVSFPVCTSIGNGAFYSCRALTEASFPACTSIEYSAFTNCSALTKASFPACTEIGSSAFYNCPSLTEAYFPVCTSIGNGAFINCISLKTISFTACSSIQSNAFYSCSALTEAFFPSCTSIGMSAFKYCASLTTVSLPVCAEIGYDAFVSCYNLISLYLLGSSIVSLKNNAFYSTPIYNYSVIAGQYGSVFVPASLYVGYLSASYWRSISSRIVSVMV